MAISTSTPITGAEEGQGPPRRFSTVRLTLRRHELDDAAALAAALNDWDVVEWLAHVPQPYTQEDARRWILQTTENWRSGRAWQFMVATREGRVVGHMGIRSEEEAGAGELGYWFAREAWGQGYATEAGTGMLDFAFDALRLQRVRATARPDNQRSKQVLEKLGLTRVGTRPQRFDQIGQTLEAPLFEITRTRWREARNGR